MDEETALVRPIEDSAEMGKRKGGGWTRLKQEWYVVVMTLGLCFGPFLFGYHLGFSSPTEDNIRVDVGLSDNSVNIMFSLLSLGCMIGALGAGEIAKRSGRRIALLWSALPYCIGSVTSVMVLSMAGLCTGRIFIGIGVGASSVLVPLYITEVAPMKLRGLLGCFNQLFIALGLCAVNVIGLPAVTHVKYWRWMMLMTIPCVFIQFVTVLFFGPESPRWLIQQHRANDARKALKILRRTKDVDAELHDLAVDTLQGGEKPSDVGFGVLFEPQYRRVLLTGILLVLLLQWSGINDFMFHTKKLFEGDNDDDYKGPGLNSSSSALYGAIITNGVQFLATVVSAVLIDKRGRRFFIILSGYGMAVSCAVMGVVYKIDASEPVKIAVVMAYVIFFSLGLGSLAFLIVCEITPARVRAKLVSFVLVVSWFSSFAVTCSYNTMNDELTESGTFWFFCAVCVVGTTLVCIYVPETKGLTLEEVEELFRNLEKSEYTTIDSPRMQNESPTLWAGAKRAESPVVFSPRTPLPLNDGHKKKQRNSNR